jgi:hypothetical protein
LIIDIDRYFTHILVHKVMQTLGLTPLPQTRLEAELPESAGWEDFVPEQAVKSHLERSRREDDVPGPDFCLTAHEDDFAGVLPSVAPQRRSFGAWSPADDGLGVSRQVEPLFHVEARATPPVVLWRARPTGSEVGQRWWLPSLMGLAAVLGLSSVIFFSFAAREATKVDAAQPEATAPARAEASQDSTVAGDGAAPSYVVR